MDSGMRSQFELVKSHNFRVGLVAGILLAATSWSLFVSVPSFESQTSVSRQSCNFSHSGQHPSQKSILHNGNWIGVHGSIGYVLAAWNGCPGTASGSDLVHLPSDITVRVINKDGGRYVFANPTSDPRALQTPHGKSRQAAGWFAAEYTDIVLRFKHSFTGKLSLYSVNWNSARRKELITVTNEERTYFTTLQSFKNGVWLSFPITVVASHTLIIRVQNESPGSTTYLSGIFLD